MRTLCTLVITLFVTILLLPRPSYSQVGGQVILDPTSIPQFVDPLPHFAGLRVDATDGVPLTIKAVPNWQVAVSTGTVLDDGVVGTDPGAGLANFWTYSIYKNNVEVAPPLWPSFTVEAQRGAPVNVTYENDLWDQTYADVGLILDQTLHWANPFDLPMDDPARMDPYDGPVPIVPHLHGAEVPSESDGGPDAWFTPGYGITGPSWGIDGTDQYYSYPDDQEAGTLWYHDHLLGGTRLNVYAGLAGFYFLRGDDEEDDHLPGWSGDDLVQEVAPDGTSGVFNPNPYLPEIEIAIQDRMFDTYGGLYFYNDEAPNPDVHPFWAPEFFGEVITVNGKTWPYLSVAPRKYRFRFLDGSNARFYAMWLQNPETGAKGPIIYQIGTDGGLMDSPAPLYPVLGQKLFMAPDERADVIIDFSRSAPGQVWTLMNSANGPYPDGDPVVEGTNDRIMQFVVNGNMVDRRNHARPRSPLVKLTNFNGSINVTPDVTRQLTLNEVASEDGPLEVLVNNTKWNGKDEDGNPIPGFTPDLLGNYLSELPEEGTTEVWQIINTTMDAHPIHLHLVQFQLISRQTYDEMNWTDAYNAAFPGGEFIGDYGPPNDYYTPNADGAIGGNPAVNAYLTGSPRNPEKWEKGWKDTFKMFPGEVTTVIVRFAPTYLSLATDPSELLYPFDPSEGPGYVWHCHIVDHEDNEMMRPYNVVASPYRVPVAPVKPGEQQVTK
jgi:spore coat protein A